MKEYIITPGEKVEDSPKASISCNNWNYSYAPIMAGQLTYLEDTGLIILLSCFEKNPMTRYTNPYDPVHTDSCMEIFLNVFPEKSNLYLNFETNSNGAYCSGVGEGRHNRLKTLYEYGMAPKIEITKTDEMWQAKMTIPRELIKAVYGDDKLSSGDYMLGNIYKCGEFGENVHFLSWSEIDTPSPDFHRPEFFGKFIIK